MTHSRRRQPSASRRARRRRRRSRRSPTTRSSPNCHTGALVAPDGAIDWLCVPRFDAPSVFGSLLDREAGFFRLGPFGINHPTARAYEPGTNVLVTTWKTPSGWIVVRDALTMGPRDHEDDDHAAHAAAGRRRRATTCSCARSSASRARSRSSSSASPAFDYGRDAGRVDARRRRPARGRRERRRADDPPRLRPARSGSRATASAARHVLDAGERAYCALSWAEGLAAPDDVDDGRRADRRAPRASGAPGSAGRGSPTTAAATRSSARRSRSRA